MVGEGNIVREYYKLAIHPYRTSRATKHSVCADTQAFPLASLANDSKASI